MNQMAGGAAQGIGPSSPGMQKMMPPGLQKQMPQQFPMMKPNLAQYAQQGEAAGNNMDWMKQPAPEFMGGGPMDPSPNGMKELIQRMKTRNTGINGGRSPIQTDPRFQF
jgi:hypothetical protein